MKLFAWNPSTKFVTVRVDPWEQLEVCHGLVDAAEFRQAMRSANDSGLSESEFGHAAGELFDLLLIYAESRGVCIRPMDHRFDIDVRAGL